MNLGRIYSFGESERKLMASMNVPFNSTKYSFESRFTVSHLHKCIFHVSCYPLNAHVQNMALYKILYNSYRHISVIKIIVEKRLAGVALYREFSKINVES